MAASSSESKTRVRTGILVAVIICAALMFSHIPAIMTGIVVIMNVLAVYEIFQAAHMIPERKPFWAAMAGAVIELEEAAYVDGCGTLRTFLKIMLPDAKPILVSCFLFSFVWQWTDGFYSKMFLGNTKLLSIQLSRIATQLGAYITTILKNSAGASPGYTSCIISTGTLMVIIPLLVLYLFAQKGFVESLSSTGIKG